VWRRRTLPGWTVPQWGRRPGTRGGEAAVQCAFMVGRLDRSFARELRCAALLAVLSIGFLWRCNFTGRAMVPGDLLLIMEPWRHYSRQFPEFKRVKNPLLDPIQQFYPWRKFAGESLRRGELPLWNQYVLCGNPFVGNNQSAVFYPETWLHAVMPTDRALGWATSLYLFISGALMFWFLRLIGLRRGPGLVGALAFMFNGFVVAWLCCPSLRSVSGWLPGMLVGFEWTLRGRRAAGTALCGLLTGLQFLSGHLHISLFVLLLFGAYGAWRCFGTARQGGAGRAAAALACAGVSVGVGGMLAACQLLPTLELVTLSTRSAGLPYRALLSNGLEVQRLLTGLIPDLFGNPVDYNHWGAELGAGYRAYCESAFYVGVVPLLFAPFAFGADRLRAAFWLGVVVFGGLLATGTTANAPLYYLVPGFKSLPGIGRAVLLLSVGIAVLGALGMQGFLESARADRAVASTRVVAVALVLGVAGTVVGLWVWFRTGTLENSLPGIGHYTLMQLGRFAAFLLAGAAGAVLMTRRRAWGAAVVLAVLAADLYVYFDKYTPAVDPAYLHVPTKAVQTMQRAAGHPRMLSLGRDAIHRMSANTPMIVGLEDIQGSESLEIGASRRLLTAGCSTTEGFAQPDPSLPLIDLLGVGFVHSAFRLEPLEKLRLLSDSEGFLYANTAALPRAFVPARWRHVGPEEALALVSAPGFAPRSEVLFSGDPAPIQVLPDKPRFRPVVVARHEPNFVSLRGPFAQGEVVVLSDTYYPGWHAFEGGRELPVWRADYALRAVQTAGGSNRLSFVYFPQSLRFGVFLSLFAVTLVVSLAVGSARLRRRLP